MNTEKTKKTFYTDPKQEPLYLFTWSPAGKTYSFRYMWNHYIDNVFRKWHNLMHTFEINPEINSSGNIHFHGFYQVKDKYNWYYNELPHLKRKEVGNMRTNKVVHDFDKAMVYPRKDRDLNIFALNKTKLPYYSIPYTQKSDPQITIPKDLMDISPSQKYYGIPDASLEDLINDSIQVSQIHLKNKLIKQIKNEQLKIGAIRDIDYIDPKTSKYEVPHSRAEITDKSYDEYLKRSMGINT